MKLKNKIKSFVLLVAMLITILPTAILADEIDTTTGTKTVNVTCYNETNSDSVIPLDGAQIMMCYSNSNTMFGGPSVSVSTTNGNNSCEVTLSENGFVFQSETYTYLQVAVTGVPSGYERPDMKVYTVSDIQSNPNIEIYFKKAPVSTYDVKADNDNYYIETEYCDGVYNYTYIYIKENGDFSKNIIDACKLLTTEDTNAFMMGDVASDASFEISAEALAALKNANVFVDTIFHGDNQYGFGSISETSDTLSFNFCTNTSVTASLDAAKIPYLLFEAKGINNVEKFYYWGQYDERVLEKGTYNESSYRYEDSKYLYYYDSTNNIFVLCDSNFIQYTYVEDDEEFGVEVASKGTLFPYSGYYVIVDEKLPTSLTEPNVELSQTIEGTKDVVTLDAEAGVVPEGTKMTVSKITEGETYTNAETALADVVNETTEMHLYDITLLSSENVKVQPNGKVQITIELEEKIDANTSVLVYRIEDDGTKTAMEDAKIVDGKVVFTTDHFSTYAILLNEIADVPDTSDNAPILLSMIILFAGVTLVIANKKYIVK